MTTAGEHREVLIRSEINLFLKSAVLLLFDSDSAFKAAKKRVALFIPLDIDRHTEQRRRIAAAPGLTRPAKRQFKPGLPAEPHSLFFAEAIVLPSTDGAPWRLAAQGTCCQLL